MTMPKKGTRKIVVDGTTYNYRVRGIKHPHLGYVVETKLLIELSESSYYTETRKDLWEVTPKEVEEIIRKEID